MWELILGETALAELTHFDEEGRSRMVDVSDKDETLRVATARGSISMQPDTFKKIQDKEIEKGDVLGVARVAGIMAAKKTADLIPMCHPLNLTAVDIYFYPDREKSRIEIEAQVKITGKTGVEMEALTAASVAGLTVYDMCKAVDRGMILGPTRLLEKSGGKSGHFTRTS
jgi:cyclic pyranopterin phosphate synthase